ncbi:MAG: rhomboid family intramembrane serine protease [Spirochaetes bacterium]|nr:rhomboid family intramembrane serine protease [Spirochaetota bacterium]
MARFSLYNIWASFKAVLFIVIILWAILFIGYIFPIHEYGIRPRILSGLIGIPLSPFIHAGTDHLVANSISLLVLGSIFITMERKLSAPIIIQIIVLGGLGVWLIGRSDFTHIGASGVVYGILGYLLTAGIFTRNFTAILVSIILFVLYGGAIWGIFPTDGFVSWESHLCGFLAGIITAKEYSGRGT